MRKNDYVTKKYLDASMKDLLEEIKRHNDTLHEKFHGDLKAMTEQVPTYDGVRKIVREELHERLTPIESDIKIIKAEVTDHSRRIRKLEHAI